MQTKHTKIKEIILEADKGSEITNCIREAIQFSVEEWRDVVLIHNERRFTVKASHLFDMVAKSAERAVEK